MPGNECEAAKRGREPSTEHRDRGYRVFRSEDAKRYRREHFTRECDAHHSYYERREARKDWSCVECRAINNTEEAWCLGCGAPGYDYGRDQNQHRNDKRMFSCRSDEFVKSDRMDDYCGTTERPIVERPLPQRGSKESDAGTISDFDQALDEFGRKIIPKQPSTPVWPPCFETHGSSFTFDTRSSMFYENESDFFYDPKSKLYYGNKSQIYYRYDPFATHFFVEVQKIDESKMTVASENEIIHAPGKPSSTYSKPPTISINIKSKSLKVKKKQRTEDIKPDRATPAVSIPFRAKKKHETDMEKWSNRQTEKQHDVERPVLGSVPAISSKVTRTANGEPICVLCQRKFPNLEKLKVHERASKLHQENLKKQGLSKRDNEEKQKNYADRAQQRRNMYGVESMPVCTVLPAIESTPIPTQLSATDTLGTSNIGNKMLQKLGWKEGNSIGRSVGQGSHHGSQQVQLAKEWERIEALADANMAKRPHR